MVDYFDRLTGLNKNMAQRSAIQRQDYMNTQALQDREKQQRQQELDMESANKARWFGQAGGSVSAATGLGAMAAEGASLLGGTAAAAANSAGVAATIAGASNPIGWAVGAATLIGMAIFGAVQMRDMQ